MSASDEAATDGRAARKVSTRARIVLAASPLFADRGYTGTSMDDIADAAGVSKGAIFYNFKSKADLFAELVHTAAATTASDIEAARAGLSGWAALDAVAWSVLRRVDASPAAAQILLNELLRSGRPWEASLRDARDILVAPLVAVLAEIAQERLTADPTCAPILPEHRPGLALSLLGSLVVAALDRRTYSPERTLADVHQVLLTAVSGLRC